MAKYNNFGSMKLKKEKDKDGNPQYYIELDQKIIDRLKFDGKPLDKFIQVERPTAKFDRMLNSGKLSQDEYDAKVAQFDKDGKLSFVKFDLQIVTKD
jgi:hypothetical protein